MSKPDWEAFGREIMEEWPGGGLDGFDLQEVAVRHGVIEETRYSPGDHGPCPEGITEPGDPWFVRCYA